MPRSSLHRPSSAGASAPPAAAPSPLSEYLVAKEPGRRERAENWRVVIGLQKVDRAAFFRNILFGERNELKNRYLHIRAKELGLVAPIASGVNKPDVTNRVGINVGIKLSPQEQRAKDLLVADPTLSAPKLGARLGVTGRQAERIVSSLKAKLGLRRVGSRKTGRWEFPSRPAT